MKKNGEIYKLTDARVSVNLKQNRFKHIHVLLHHNQTSKDFKKKERRENIKKREKQSSIYWGT